MKILFVADTHSAINLDKIQRVLGNIKPDYIIGLGDVSYSDYILLRYSHIANNIPIGCVLGNHDAWNDIQNLNRRGCRLVDLNRKNGHIGDITFYALSGALKYKNSDTYCFLTHKESEEIIKTAPKADILLSHDHPYWGKILNNQEFQNAHEGLIGLANYIRKNSPALHIHGHLHQAFEKNVCNGCREICVYGYALIDVSKENGMITYNIISQTDKP